MHSVIVGVAAKAEELRGINCKGEPVPNQKAVGLLPQPHDSVYRELRLETLPRAIVAPANSTQHTPEERYIPGRVHKQMATVEEKQQLIEEVVCLVLGAFS